MSILDDLKKWAHPYEDEDEEYEDDFPDLASRGEGGDFADDRRSAERKAEERRNKVVNIHATTQLKVVLVKPERFENASEIADHLKEKRTVVINLESTNKDIARRLVDFLSGDFTFFHCNLSSPHPILGITNVFAHIVPFGYFVG